MTIGNNRIFDEHVLDYVWSPSYRSLRNKFTEVERRPQLRELCRKLSRSPSTLVAR